MVDRSLTYNSNCSNACRWRLILAYMTSISFLRSRYYSLCFLYASKRLISSYLYSMRMVILSNQLFTNIFSYSSRYFLWTSSLMGRSDYLSRIFLAISSHSLSMAEMSLASCSSYSMRSARELLYRYTVKLPKLSISASRSLMDLSSPLHSAYNWPHYSRAALISRSPIASIVSYSYCRLLMN